VPPHTAGEENPIVNTATVTGKDEFDRQVSDTDQHSTQILHPAIAIDKTGPANATQGDLISYNLTVTNPGDQSFADANVHVTDQQCTTPVTLVVKNRGGGLDPTPGTLDPGDSWVYACSAQTSVGQTRLDNIGSVTGTDSHGHTVNAQDTATTVLGEQVVAGQEILPGQAKLAGKSGCVAKAFTVKVSGRSIDRVVITIDGKRKAILHASGTNGKTVKFKVDPRKFKPGSHLLVAKTYFTADTGTKPKTLKLRFSRCIRRTAPAFTG
jgi:hypothetical protein